MRVPSGTIRISTFASGGSCPGLSWRRWSTLPAGAPRLRERGGRMNSTLASMFAMGDAVLSPGAATGATAPTRMSMVEPSARLHRRSGAGT